MLFAQNFSLIEWQYRRYRTLGSHVLVSFLGIESGMELPCRSGGLAGWEGYTLHLPQGLCPCVEGDPWVHSRSSSGQAALFQGPSMKGNEPALRGQLATPTGSPHLTTVHRTLPPSRVIEELHRALATKHRQDR